mmetsp:Transcript_4999/g.12510  ORF Transcript_4999/g.12510 Transcript_4999/m.12510 type:complete len:427 (-) Transcript_4999:79-1359(-)
MAGRRSAAKKKRIEIEKTTESEFYRRGHEGLRPLKRVVCYKDADETTDDSDGDYSPETTRKRARTQTQTQTRTRREKLVTITRMMTRGWRRPTLLQLTYYDCPSSRMRAIKTWGSEIPAPDRRQATQRRVFEGKFINGKRVIGTYADKKSMTLHTLDQPSTSVYSGGRPYVATGPGEDERENTGSHLDISLRLMSFPEEDNMVAFARIEEAMKRRKKDTRLVRFINRAFPFETACRFLRAAIKEHGAEDKYVVQMSVCGAMLNAGGEAARAVAGPKLLLAKNYEACWTCEAFHNARTELRGEAEVQKFKAVVLGEAGDRYVMDIGDGQGEVWHAVDCTWDQLAADMKKSLDDVLKKRNLRRENVFVYCDATPPCSGISPVSHPSDEVKASCMKLIKQTDAFVHRMHAAGVFDAALFENVKACIDAW